MSSSSSPPDAGSATWSCVIALPAERMEAGRLEPMVASMGDLAGRVRAHLADWQAEARAENPSSEDSPEPDGMMSGKFV